KRSKKTDYFLPDTDLSERIQHFLVQACCGCMKRLVADSIKVDVIVLIMFRMPPQVCRNPLPTGDVNPICTLEDYSKPSYKGYMNTFELPVENNVVPLLSDTIRIHHHIEGSYYSFPCSILSTDKDRKTSQRYPDFPTTSRRISQKHELVSRTYSKKSLIMTSIFGSKFKSFITMLLPPQDEPLTNQPMASFVTETIHPKQQSDSHDDNQKENEGEEKNNQEDINTNPSTPPDPSVSFITEKVLKLNSFFELLGLAPQLSGTEFVYTKGDGDMMFIKIVKKNDDSRKGEPEAEGLEVDYFNIFPTWSELAYHKYLICGPIPSIFLRNPIITEGYPSNLKIPCNIKHVHVEKAYIDLNSPLNIMTRMIYNWIKRRKLDPMENSDRGIRNFTGRIKEMHVFVRNFTYAMDFMIVKDISSIIDPRLSQVGLGKPFIEISNMTHDPPEGVVRFTNRTDEITYKMPHKIE
nr:MAK10-like protein [Tanacetum cinerariifolium]